MGDNYKKKTKKTQQLTGKFNASAQFCKFYITQQKIQTLIIVRFFFFLFLPY